MPGPDINNLFTEYIDTIPMLPKTVDSGINALEYFKAKHLFTDVSLFNNIKFQRKIN
jgi:hypothetical protein